jgi:hypothetical protein
VPLIVKLTVTGDSSVPCSLNRVRRRSGGLGCRASGGHCYRDCVVVRYVQRGIGRCARRDLPGRQYCERGRFRGFNDGVIDGRERDDDLRVRAHGQDRRAARAREGAAGTAQVVIAADGGLRATAHGEIHRDRYFEGARALDGVSGCRAGFRRRAR